MVHSRLTGSCKALYCLKIARGIDLKLAQQSLTSSSRTHFHHKTRFPEGAGMSAPLRLTWKTEAYELDQHKTASEVEISLYELGALCITWHLPLDSLPEELVGISAQLYAHEGLIARSKQLATEVMAALGPALNRPLLSEYVEDYVIFEAAPAQGGPEKLLSGSRTQLAQILRAESEGLSEQEVDDALAHPVSYGKLDVCLVDWLAAFLMGADMEDERFVLELATVELLELRLLDSRLEDEVKEAYEILARKRGLWSAFTVQRRELEHVARIQADDAQLHEGIDNALKLFGDDYLARLYRTSSKRFHFEEWDTSIQRKLELLRTVTQSMSDLASHRRAEILEWIIIVLIAVDILLYFTPLR